MIAALLQRLTAELSREYQQPKSHSFPHAAFLWWAEAEERR